jgi:drug/metabolite transporter (DMT)-like permease
MRRAFVYCGPHDDAHRHHHRLHGRSPLVPPCPADRSDRHDPAVPARGHDLPDRRAGGHRELDRAAAGHQGPAPEARRLVLGLGGLFGYHALYFAALRLAPPAESGLINYLWPLLIVLFSSLLPGERLKPAHLVGAFLGFAGVVVLIAGRGALDARAEYLPGYACALVAAFVWGGYSVLSRRFGQVPTDAVAGFCLVTAALSLVCHLLFETAVWPESDAQWLALLALGLGPVGAAFYVWDIGMKRGDIRLLGVASYATPVLSTLILVLAGYAEPTLTLALSCSLIVLGALVATLMGKRARA